MAAIRQAMDDPYPEDVWGWYQAETGIRALLRGTGEEDGLL
jgi:hypothetical protein